MDTLKKVEEISVRLDHLATAGEWINRALHESDSSAAKTGELIAALTEDVRELLLKLVTDLEERAELGMH